MKFAVYMYFLVAVIAEQELTEDPKLIIPIMLILKLIFFFGWFEVAKAIDDPWDGKDHEDFKVSPFLIQMRMKIEGGKPPFLRSGS